MFIVTYAKKWIKKLLALFGCEIQYVKNKGRTFAKMEDTLSFLHEKGFRPEYIMDVGANNGDWSRLAKKVFPDTKFILFEPQIEFEKELDDFCKLTPGSKYFLFAAGKSLEEKQFYVNEELAGSSFFHNETESFKEKRIVKVHSIDDLLVAGQIKQPSLVKLDVQGYELEVLKGANTLFGVTDVFILETSIYPFSQDLPIVHEVIDFMAKREYVLFDISGFIRRELDNALGQLDLCFVKKGGPFHNDFRWNC
jgi:FkbM family methyltransferase